MNKKGFTLIEVMLVISLIAVIASLVSFTITGLNRYLVRAETEKLYALCRYLQQSAMVKNKSLELTFDVLQKKYQYDKGVYQLPPQVIFGFIDGTKGPPSAPSHLVTNPITFPANKIVFYPNGSIQSGTAYLVDQGKNYMYALTSPISQVSYLRTYVYHNKWELLQ